MITLSFWRRSGETGEIGNATIELKITPFFLQNKKKCRKVLTLYDGDTCSVKFVLVEIRFVVSQRLCFVSLYSHRKNPCKKII